mgnify:CR=1 FL=1
MEIDKPHRGGGPVSLSALLDEAAQRLPPRQAGPMATDGFLFSGNRHESVPRALFFDHRLTPLERNAWQVFDDDGITAFPTYEQLRPYLASTPCASKASHETVARALTLLRLTRWLSLVRRRRDPRTGRIQGNLYVLHDEPLTPFEAMQLDPDYLDLVNQALTHASKAVRHIGVQTLKEIAEDPLLNGCALPTRLQVLAHSEIPETHTIRRCWRSGWRARSGTHSKVIHRTRRFTKPKKARKPFFGTENSRLRNPKRVAKPRQTAFFGIRSRTVQYVKKVLKIIKYVQYRAREKTFVCLSAFSS